MNSTRRRGKMATKRLILAVSSSIIGVVSLVGHSRDLEQYVQSNRLRMALLERIQISLPQSDPHWFDPEQNDELSTTRMTLSIDKHGTDSTNDDVRKNESTSATTKFQRRRQRHVVFIGDALLRSSYLEWLHHRHKYDFIDDDDDDDDFPPEQLLNEKMHTSRQAYFEWLSTYFDGRMTMQGNQGESHEHFDAFDLSYRSKTIRETMTTARVRYEDVKYNETTSYHATFIHFPSYNNLNTTLSKDEVGGKNATQSERIPASSFEEQICQSGSGLIMMMNYISKLEPKPTAIVMNFGHQSNCQSSEGMRRILNAAHTATNKEGVIVWRGGMTRTVDNDTAKRRSDADKEAERWSHNVHWLFYQPFQSLNVSESSLTVEDDDKNNIQSSDPTMYRRWNKELESFLEPQKKYHRAFVLVGGARTMENTVASYASNFVLPLCPPHICVAHLVTHLSTSDNRPSTSDDPVGQVVDGHDANIMEYLNDPILNIKVHPVKGYNIGSTEEQAAMDDMSLNFNATIRRRLQTLRSADPRRYSMWFARAWAWATVEDLSMLYDFDFFAFTRPDLLWLTSVNTVDFFKAFESKAKNDVWVHDVYFNNVPDTFALFTSKDAASRYFSLSELVRPGVACLGGPNFNETLVASRLEKSGIQTSPSDWCKNIPSPTPDQGWSERILRRKLEMSGLQVRYFSASAVLLRHFTRPSDNVTVLLPECFAVNRFTHIGFAATNKNISGSPFVGCAQLSIDIDLDFPIISLSKFSLSTYQTFYIQSMTIPRQCLELVNETLQPARCDKLSATQMFTGSKRDEIVGLTYECFKTGACPRPNSFVVPNNIRNLSFGFDEEWEKVPVHLNHIFPYNHWEIQTID